MSPKNDIENVQGDFSASLETVIFEVPEAVPYLRDIKTFLFFNDLKNVFPGRGCHLKMIWRTFFW